MNETTPIIELNQVRFSWNSSQTESPILDISEFQVFPGERVFLKGPSGSGKTTLLGLIGGVLSAQSGTVSVLGQPLHQWKGGKRDKFRASHIGFIFQMFNLIPYLSVIENVLLPCRFAKLRRDRALKETTDLTAEGLRLLNALDLKDPALLQRSITELSVGQQQRVAAARALIGRPELIIADEPTSALDTDTRAAFLKLLFKECEAANTTLLFVSHDSALASVFDRSLSLPELNQVNQLSHD